MSTSRFRWWYLPMGCGLLLVLLAAIAAAIFAFAASMMRSVPAYDTAMAMANADADVAEVLGTPIEAGFFVTGRVDVNPASGSADLLIPVHGPTGRGRLYVSARKQAGEWLAPSVALEVEGSERIAVDGI